MRRILLAAVALAACGDTRAEPRGRVLPTNAPQAVRVNASMLLTRGGAFAESSYMACIRSYWTQGLPLQQIYELCATKLQMQSEMGFGGAGKEFSIPPATPSGFDASSVAVACGATDPTRSAGEPLQRVRPKYEVGFSVGKDFLDFGGYTWGGKGQPGPEPGSYYKGLTREESNQIKRQLALEAGAKYIELLEAEEAASADPKNEALRKKADELRKQFDELKKKADADPNLVKSPPKPPTPSPDVSEGAEGSACATVLQAARELLAECHRTGWKAAPCKDLNAKMRGCPSPTLIYVDPDAGYACSPTVDPALVLDAWMRRCKQITTPGPDGGSPCSPPQPSESGATMTGNDRDVCRNPVARTDGDTDGCIAVLEVDSFGQTDIGGLIVWAQGVLGGPIVVLPERDPPVIWGDDRK